ncbi:sarcosine oxidase subunit delta [Pseudooceanicola sediminis]|uniref:Sarcosine oxidase subunit delta n=1 Tax=Pseudooceanicola sediminis TaxID=2211117 RepID=A0A399J416_9RHOB|nr:sarcosine oxidase subunit delta [Pseudooceanicola sediminis]KAA2316259.1 sarcosine oxidase subunit delta [Puniceibacterium sp. HSS470]RII39169.1 sarcosine oxidase subunit delta [Pseudooceanicola sediminis]|tara:strand:+ start:74367 stop:74621 length:255 start_codon:yes stop_codon:yes gene_type:complete
MRLTCPNCGERDLREFTYRGAALDRPEGAWSPAWDAYLHQRDNPAGASREHWWHGFGCSAFLVVERDTRTHDILSVSLASGGRQ